MRVPQPQDVLRAVAFPPCQRLAAENRFGDRLETVVAARLQAGCQTLMLAETP